MLKLRVSRDTGGPLVLFGLSAANIVKLQQGMPVRINMAEVGMEGEVVIFAGETEEAMMNDLRAAGMLPAAAAGGKPS